MPSLTEGSGPQTTLILNKEVLTLPNYSSISQTSFSTDRAFLEVAVHV